MKFRDMPSRDMALLAVGDVLMLVGAVTLIGGWMAASIAIPAIAAGVALVIVARSDAHRQHGKHIPGT